MAKKVKKVYFTHTTVCNSKQEIIKELENILANLKSQFTYEDKKLEISKIKKSGGYRTTKMQEFTCKDMSLSESIELFDKHNYEI